MQKDIDLKEVIENLNTSITKFREAELGTKEFVRAKRIMIVRFEKALKTIKSDMSMVKNQLLGLNIEIKEAKRSNDVNYYEQLNQEMECFQKTLDYLKGKLNTVNDLIFATGVGEDVYPNSAK